MYQRRDVLKSAIGGLAAFAAPAQAMAQADAGAARAPETPAFSANLVIEAARGLAKKPYKAPVATLPDPFANLGYDAYVGIRNRPESRLWADEMTGFAIEPLHRGFLFGAPMQINIVESGQVRRLTYSPSQFEFGKLNVPANTGDIGFSGFRVLRPREGATAAEVAVFQGASFFRAVATGQSLGVMSRGLSLRTGDPRGEEFPLFREVWIERPSLATNALVIHALLDSESAAGAYRFTLRPGDATIIDTECTLIARTTIDHCGLATMTGTFLLGPIDRRRSDDVRPAVCDFSGLQMLTGRGEWIWRPVANRETLQVSSFLDENPAGFGFIQSDRDFDRFQDDDQHWEMRPTLWIEPIGDWGPGNVTLIEIPSESEINQNIIAYWRPKATLAAASETSFAYRQFWCWTPPNRPKLAAVTTSRSGRLSGQAAGARRRRFLVEFSGDAFADGAKPVDVTPNLSCAPGVVSNVRSFISRQRKTCRVMFDLDPGSETFAELRLLLEAEGKPVSSTWLYRWTP